MDRVCFTLDDTFLEVPTYTGLTDQPVSRADYLTVVPRPGEAQTAPPTTRSGPEATPAG
jgi:hypothetical protein